MAVKGFLASAATSQPIERVPRHRDGSGFATKGEQFAPVFLRISPNKRIPALVDPQGPDGAPLSILESGAILQHLGR